MFRSIPEYHKPFQPAIKPLAYKTTPGPLWMRLSRVQQYVLWVCCCRAVHHEAVAESRKTRNNARNEFAQHTPQCASNSHLGKVAARAASAACLEPIRLQGTKTDRRCSALAASSLALDEPRSHCRGPSPVRHDPAKRESRTNLPA